MHFLSMLLLLCICVQLAVSKQRLEILGLYPKDGNGWTEPFVEYSAELALKHIELNGSILRDYQITIDWKNTKCDGGVALKEFIDAIGNNRSKTYMAVFGGGCAVATSQVAALSYRYGLAQIGYASTAPNLGNQNLYQSFVRGVPSDINAIPARASFIKDFNWRRVAIINEQDPIFVASSHIMESVLDRLNVEYRVEDFDSGGTLPLDQQVKTIAENLNSNGYRIIIANMYEDAAIKLFCKLYQQKEKFLLPNIATWIFLGWFTNQWHNKPEVLAEVGCTAEEVASVSNGALGFLVVYSKRSFKGDSNNAQLTIANLTPAQIYQEYKNSILENINNDASRFNQESDSHDAYVYDSLWTLALSLQEMTNRGTNLYEVSQKNIFKDNNYLSEYSKDLYNRMKEQIFIGWTGRVEFRNHERFSDRVQLLEFVDGNLVHRGDFEEIPYNKNNSYTVEEIENIIFNSDEEGYKGFIYWDKEKASDGIKDLLIPVPIISMWITMSVAIIIYVTFLIVVIITGMIQKLESIKNSSPILTCIILGGNYLLLLAGVFYISNDRLLGHKNGEFRTNVTGEQETTEVCDSHLCKALCMFPISLLLVASSLIFGGMVGKATVIYLCAVKLHFTLSYKMKLVLRFIWPILFTCIDVIFVVIWTFVSSLVMKSEVLPTGGNEPPFIRVIQCRHSANHEFVNNALIGVLIFYKSMIVLIGLVMAYNLRNIKKASLRYWETITWTMYNTSIFTLVLIMSFFLIQDYVIKQTIVTALMLLTVCITSSITGLPPVYFRFKDPRLHKERANLGNTDMVIKNEHMWESEVTALRKDGRELISEIEDLKSENMEMARRMSEIDPTYSLGCIAEKPESEAIN